jgi:hypothetical protein
MKNVLVLAFSIAAVALTGCHKIYYHNGGQMVANKSAAQYNEWHHIGVFGLVEFSDPIELNRMCQGKWTTLETENSFLSGLVSGVTYGLYTPREANLVCK